MKLGAGLLEDLLGHAAGVEAAGVHDVGDALCLRHVAQGVVGMGHPADGEDDDGGLVGDATVGVGAVIVFVGVDPVEVSEPQGIAQGLVACGVGRAADEGNLRRARASCTWRNWKATGACASGLGRA